MLWQSHLCKLKHYMLITRVLSREWIQAQVTASDRAQISVLYASAYGNTAALAQGISRGITKAGMCLMLHPGTLMHTLMHTWHVRPSHCHSQLSIMSFPDQAPAYGDQ